jgi:uncharacterized Ntn-hydrolase superfamily protein
VTYSIIARCPRSGQLGVASATFSIACGRRNESVQPNVGVSKSQAFYLRQVDVTALRMLGLGYTPQHVMDTFGRSDDDFDYRQFGIIDLEGRVAVHTGPKTKGWSGHHVGEAFACYGNVLKGPETVQGIARGFMSKPEAPLHERLLRAIEGGRDAGGQASDGEPWPERSAWLRVVGQFDWPLVDLRVDLHTDAVAELRRIYAIWLERHSPNAEPREGSPVPAV